MSDPTLDINTLNLASDKDKIPSVLHAAMQGSTHSEVVLVPIHKPGRTVTTNRNHLHCNVKD